MISRLVFFIKVYLLHYVKVRKTVKPITTTTTATFLSSRRWIHKCIYDVAERDFVRKLVLLTSQLCISTCEQMLDHDVYWLSDWQKANRKRFDITIAQSRALIANLFSAEPQGSARSFERFWQTAPDLYVSDITSESSKAFEMHTEEWGHE